MAKVTSGACITILNVSGKKNIINAFILIKKSYMYSYCSVNKKIYSFIIDFISEFVSQELKQGKKNAFIFANHSQEWSS